MAKRPTYQVPFGEDGALLHWADPRPGAWAYDQAAAWRDPEPFHAELTILDTMRGRSAAYFRLKDDLARCWPMFMAEVLDLIRTAVITEGTVKGYWIPCKRGQNYGLRYLGQELES
jgi:hypothetical protein